jgi:uncharacterized phage protein (predicted DNA packaging)
MTDEELKLLKLHCRADDYQGDDELLAHYWTAARAYVIQATYRTEDELTEMGNGEFPPQLTQCVLMLAAHWYNQRESVSGGAMSRVPDALSSLLLPFRKLAD